ncbi:magnesium and cobalt transporter [Paracoccus solventivorans]|uniref:Magnesium and cobalt transporter n=2 Tax=Pseudomonadota TaxID=1224 RepID=A0A1M7JR52_9RHOB|nr:CBS domain-containing protein [Paracoccus solventivorans]SHM55464.1 magnesium and cobalt transporter [Paracoccus solventivorans]
MSLPQTPARPDHGPARNGGPDSAALAAEPEPEPSPGLVARDLAPPQPSAPDHAADPASAPREAPARRLLGRILKTLVPLAPGDDEQGPDSMMEAATSAEAPSILNLRRKTVDDVALTRADIVAVPVTVGLQELVEVFRDHGYSRLPVYRGNLDEPLGLVHLKDLALKHGFAPKSAPRFALRPLLRPLLYVPGSMPIGALLQQMQQKRIHMALLIDEYGGVDGLVTIEDLIEQVIGQIDDEHDESDEDLWVPEGPGQWLVLARAPIERVEAEVGLKLTGGVYEEEIDTLGGLIFMLAGRVPCAGEVIADESGAEFEIVEAGPRRIKRVRLRIPGREETEAELSA